MRIALFWVITQSVVLHYWLRNDPEERSSKQYAFLKIILKTRKGHKLKY